MPDIYDCIKSAPSTQNRETFEQILNLSGHSSFEVCTDKASEDFQPMKKHLGSWTTPEKLYVAFMCFLLLFIHVLNFISIATTTESCSPSKPTD